MVNKENIRKIDQMIYMLEKDISFLEKIYEGIKDYENGKKSSIKLKLENVLISKLLDEEDLNELISIMKIKVSKMIDSKKKELDEIQAGIAFDDVVHKKIVNNS